MRMIAFALGAWLLASGTASAFNCVHPKLPWDRVVCSDPELQRLADQRLVAFEQAEKRLSPGQIEQLRQDQIAWVRSYSASCGAPGNKPAPDPVPTFVIQCFRRAGTGRLAYLRAYGLSEGTAQIVPSTPGVSSSAPVTEPLRDWCASLQNTPNASPPGVVICSDLELRSLAVERQRAFNAAEARLDPEHQHELQADQANWVNSYLATCGIPRIGAAPNPVPEWVKDCFKHANETRVEYLRAYGTKPEKITHPEAQSPPLTTQQAMPSQQAVPMRLAGGTYVVPVRINAAITLPFTVDSGAADVLIPADVALTLARAGTIAPEDFTGDKTYTLADGSTLKSTRFILREMQVGDQVIRNVIASLGPVQGDLLLGQSFLSRFSSWTLDNERHALVLGPLPGGSSSPGPLKSQKPVEFQKPQGETPATRLEPGIPYPPADLGGSRN